MSIKTLYIKLSTPAGRDLSGLVNSFRFEDCTEQDDALTLSFTAPTKDLLDDTDLHEDSELLFQFGEMGGRASRKYRLRVSNYDSNYSKTITLSIVATDSGTTLKKDESAKVWEGMTSGQIANKIADLYGMTAVIESTSKRWDSYPQGNLTHFELLKELASKENGYHVYVKGKNLHFKKRNLKKPSVRTYTYNDGNGEVIGFKPSSRETNKKGASASVEAIGIDPLTNEVITSQVDNKNVKDETKLANYSVAYEYNAASEQVGEKKVGKRVVSPAGSRDEVDTTANNEKKEAALNDITATLSLDIDPTLEADQIITVAGVAKRDAGNWYVAKVVHSGQPGGAGTSVAELKRNAANKSASATDKATDVNNSNGPAENSGKRPVKAVYYDQASAEVPASRGGSTSKVIKL